MDMNWIAIMLVSVIAFAAAPLWFWAIFWKLWAKIHGWEKLSKAELKAQEKWMWKLLVLEAINTLVMVSILSFFIIKIPGYYAWAIAFFIWLGFVFPSVVSSVIWGGDKKQWHTTKIFILAGFNLFILLISAYLLSILS